MASSKSSGGLVPAAARTPTKRKWALSEELQKLIDEIEEELGGRRELMKTLLAYEGSIAEVHDLAHLMGDPRYKGRPFHTLCNVSGITLGDLFKAYKRAILDRAKVLATKRVAEGLPEVASDVMLRARPHDQPCYACLGHKTILDPDWVPVVGQVRPEITCSTCRGSGTQQILPTPDRQKLALDLGEMLPKGSGGVAVQVNNNHQQHLMVGSGGGMLERLQQAASSVLYGEAPPVEGDIIDDGGEPPPDPVEQEA